MLNLKYFLMLISIYIKSDYRFRKVFEKFCRTEIFLYPHMLYYHLGIVDVMQSMHVKLYWKSHATIGKSCEFL